MFCIYSSYQVIKEHLDGVTVYDRETKLIQRLILFPMVLHIFLLSIIASDFSVLVRILNAILFS